MEKRVCRVCNTESNFDTFIIKEMMKLSGDEFKYYECKECGSLTISDVPDNLGDYYQNYYSFQQYSPFIKFILKNTHNDYFKENVIGRLSKIVLFEEEIWNVVANLYKSQKITYDSNILDVGCGRGIFLEELSEIGFNNLEGIDPFLDNEIITNNYCVHNQFITDYEFDKEYDLIFLKDSLEHMDNPFETLNILKNILKNDGIIIVSIPIKSEFFWNHYGTNWYELDAPRHLTTFTLDGFEKFIKRLDLNVENVIFNSDAMSFLISEDYQKGKGMNSEDAFYKKFISMNLILRIYYRKFMKFGLSCTDNKITFSKLESFTSKLNIKNQGEHAIFIIKK